MPPPAERWAVVVGGLLVDLITWTEHRSYSSQLPHPADTVVLGMSIWSAGTQER